MRRFPAPIHAVMAAMSKLPGVGPKTALRYTFALLRLSDAEREGVARAIAGLKHITVCGRCFAYAEKPICDICDDPKRVNRQLCIVAESRDIATMEATNAYLGKYFVLGGVLNPIEGGVPERLRIANLTDRLLAQPEIEEIILAFSPDVHGETTMMYLTRKFKQDGRRITRLARGLPIGADIEYADEVTLGDAFLGRRDA